MSIGYHKFVKLFLKRTISEKRILDPESNQFICLSKQEQPEITRIGQAVPFGISIKKEKPGRKQCLWTEMI